MPHEVRAYKWRNFCAVCVFLWAYLVSDAARTVTVVNSYATAINVRFFDGLPTDHVVPQYAETTFEIADNPGGAYVYNADFGGIGAVPGGDGAMTLADNPGVNHFRIEVWAGGNVYLYRELGSAAGGTENTWVLIGMGLAAISVWCVVAGYHVGKSK